MPPKGQRNYGDVRLTRHALERFAARFDVDPEDAESSLRTVLARTRRLGRNPANEAVALLGVLQHRPLVAILQADACLTVLTWPQFEPRLADFGRPRLPRKWGRLLRRLEENSLSGDRHPTSGGASAG